MIPWLPSFLPFVAYVHYTPWRWGSEAARNKQSLEETGLHSMVFVCFRVVSCAGSRSIWRNSLQPLDH